MRDFQTAKLVSDMCGTESLEFDNSLGQHEAKRQRENLARAVLSGADPFESYADFRHHDFASRHRSTQARLLITPDEVLNMPEDKQVLFVSGKNLKPIFAERHRYYTRPQFASRYLANPFHPPCDRVRVATRFGSKWVRIVELPLPEKYRSFPQYAGRDTLRCLEGYPV